MRLRRSRAQRTRPNRRACSKGEGSTGGIGSRSAAEVIPRDGKVASDPIGSEVTYRKSNIQTQWRKHHEEKSINELHVCVARQHGARLRVRGSGDMQA